MKSGELYLETYPRPPFYPAHTQPARMRIRFSLNENRMRIRARALEYLFCIQEIAVFLHNCYLSDMRNCCLSIDHAVDLEVQILSRENAYDSHGFL